MRDMGQWGSPAFSVCAWISIWCIFVFPPAVFHPCGTEYLSWSLSAFTAALLLHEHSWIVLLQLHFCNSMSRCFAVCVCVHKFKRNYWTNCIFVLENVMLIKEPYKNKNTQKQIYRNLSVYGVFCCCVFIFECGRAHTHSQSNKATAKKRAARKW